MAQGVFTPYSTVSPFLSVMPPWVPKDEQERIASYQVYEEIFWNHPETFKLVVRGTEQAKPIYIPSGRIIVETMNRYFCKDFDFLVDPRFGSDTDKEALALAFTNLFTRERFRSKFASNKRYGLIRGDWIFHVTADDTKPEGSRISINSVDPASYFPVYDDTNLDRIVKVHLAEQFTDAKGEVVVKRQTYERMDDGLIYSSLGIFKMDKWAAGDDKAVTIIQAPTALPAEITAFPVYHIKNFDEPGNPYGSSEMRGLERLMAAMNQSINDEDIALALEGLGVYTTDGGGPMDDDGNPTDWIIGPGRVVENASNFKRVQGVGSITPFKDHIGTLWEFMKASSGTPDIAVGKVDVQTAESGVALTLQMGPILSRGEEKEQFVADVMNQMFHDLKSWFAAYEGLNFPDTIVSSVFGDALPRNRKAEVEYAVQMVAAKVWSTMTAREHLAQFGFVFAADEADRIAQETQLMTEASTPVDPYAQRTADELAAGVPTDGTPAATA